MTKQSARLTVCVGGGGVGKTTSSAALGLHMARAGARTLVITVDPARRLADALGVELGQATRPAPIDPRAQDRLFARMPDPRSSMDDFTLWLFTDEERRRRFRENRAVQEMADSIAGIHEILTVTLLQHEVDSGDYDEVVLDTAPSRHALAFLTYPNRLLDLLEARALSWLAAAADNSERGEDESSSATGAIFAWGKARLEALFARVIGLPGLRSLSSMFGDLFTVRERWAALARRTQVMLADPATRYLLVGAPTGGALDDIIYLAGSLERQKLRPTAIVLNRSEQEPPAYAREVQALLDKDPSLLSEREQQILRQTLEVLASEHAARKAAADEATHQIGKRLPRGVPVVRLPFVGPASPRDIVMSLADEWSRIKLA
ncbi:MAG: ArsA-related P-loop ATPase [Myxococcales bacterium]|nr:AAA family ATPase [Polyangiaceae bacterium]MDW8248207.1 ArsA-related P-loop ATPase [Myxococcales bacterium]